MNSNSCNHNSLNLSLLNCGTSREDFVTRKIETLSSLILTHSLSSTQHTLTHSHTTRHRHHLVVRHHLAVDGARSQKKRKAISHSTVADSQTRRSQRKATEPEPSPSLPVAVALLGLLSQTRRFGKVL
ncbi:hypothetical protein RIF29_18809 [Crotalaria pallida]|uniref:Uncharacterized protein n=1 Tax=Crotalaria pallida TaxID=3830 RepID=A0AAN9I4Y2_CROPI